MSPPEKQRKDYFDRSEQVTFRLPTAEFQTLANSLKWKRRCNTKDTKQVLNGKKKTHQYLCEREERVISNVNIFLLASILITRFQTCRRGVRSRGSNDTICAALPMGNHPIATERVNCHSLLYNSSNLNSISHSTQGPEELPGLKSHTVHYSI